MSVRAGDPVLHLRKTPHGPAFLGTSLAQTDGFETRERPPRPGPWAYADRFYRAMLRDYLPFREPLLLSELFARHQVQLNDYYSRNRSRPDGARKRLFYVVQAHHLQCQNGAYLSEMEDELAEIVFSGTPGSPTGLPPSVAAGPSPAPLSVTALPTDERMAEVAQRVGQKRFSDQVSANYDSICCFPGCTVTDERFLVGAHIARWSDVPELRGQLSNGLCFCLIHDCAFERGLFTLDGQHRIYIAEAVRDGNGWARDQFSPAHGQQIKMGAIPPSDEAILHHWERTGLLPDPDPP